MVGALVDQADPPSAEQALVAVTSSGRAIDVITVSDDTAVCWDGPVAHSFDGLTPDTVHDLDGVEVRTLPRPGGELLCGVATVNDVHFGETACGVIDGSDTGPTFSVPPGATPYPEVMNAGAIAEITQLAPATVVVKGDLTSAGTTEEYRRFEEFYRPAFGHDLMVVRGNHDSYHGGTFAEVPTQLRHLDGVTLAVLDTARDHQINGSLSADQLDWLDSVGADADRPVLVFGHHNMWNPHVDPRSDHFFGLRPDDADALAAVFSRRRALCGYFAGHTHRNVAFTIPEVGRAPFVEVSCVKDFPGAWAEYKVFDGGILQVLHRIAMPDALAWSEPTRAMYGGAYAEYALGKISDRNFLIDTAG